MRMDLSRTCSLRCLMSATPRTIQPDRVVLFVRPRFIGGSTLTGPAGCREQELDRSQSQNEQVNYQVLLTRAHADVVNRKARDEPAQTFLLSIMIISSLEMVVLVNVMHGNAIYHWQLLLAVPDLACRTRASSPVVT